MNIRKSSLILINSLSGFIAYFLLFVIYWLRISSTVRIGLICQFDLRFVFIIVVDLMDGGHSVSFASYDSNNYPGNLTFHEA